MLESLIEGWSNAVVGSKIGESNSEIELPTAENKEQNDITSLLQIFDGDKIPGDSESIRKLHETNF